MSELSSAVTAPAWSQLHQPRLAELVADALRRRILDGDLADGEFLPNQEAMLAEFSVSRPSLREALRILESEGLITVRRGNVGGAVVHRPTARHAAYSLAMVLQTRHVAIDDVARTLKKLEGMCAELCAQRADRAVQVVPHLRDSNRRALLAIENELEFVAATGDFHRSLVSCSGSETLFLVVGALESLWLSHVQRWAENSAQEGVFPDRRYRRQGVAVHERITELIAGGKATAAAALTEEHFDPEQFYSASAERSRPIDAASMRMPGRVNETTTSFRGEF